MIYLDNAATTRIDEQVTEAMMPYLNEHYGNPSSIHSMGRKTRTAIEKARKSIAEHFNTSPAEIFFTSCGTESNNMVLKCAVRNLKIEHLISTKIEHHCVLHPVEELAKDKKVQVHFLSVKENGHVDLQQLEDLLQKLKGSVLVSLMHANNEIGNILDWEHVAELCRAHNAIFHSDTVQTVGHYEIDLQKVQIDFITGSAHKFHGPKGIGFLYINPERQICPLLYGGAQERNMRAGTENVYGIVGMAKALEIAYDNLEEHSRYIQGLKDYMIGKLQENVPGVSFNGDYKGKSLYTVLNCSFPADGQGDMMLFNLDINGICASGGSACSSGADQGSHVLKELNADPEKVSVRFSFSKYNTKEEIDLVVEKLKEILQVEAKA